MSFFCYDREERQEKGARSDDTLHVIFKTLATVAALQNCLIINGLLVTRKWQR